ncbi:hypothetical protein SMACR_06729 [Sordaria macrospora]|uniref:RRM domain-containing protein n=2 Tax=Sordaria macrospora TaxID=5147 RepID=A0A8S8ZQ38_SORMA|nr:hypothetical protein SMACR_06729 [Sordaria macrospora]WPJ64921.1 hypothetical protein SMAC4_06729 [Sordaria macrospora]
MTLLLCNLQRHSLLIKGVDEPRANAHSPKRTIFPIYGSHFSLARTHQRILDLQYPAESTQQATGTSPKAVLVSLQRLYFLFRNLHHQPSKPPTMTDTTRWKATVHVRGLAPAVTTATLHDAFIPFGEISDISLPKNEKPDSTDPHRGFAYVEYEDEEDAKEAIDNMDQSELFGRVIRVSAAKIPKSAKEGLGSRTAVWEQEGWLAENAVSEEDRLAATAPDDPMQGLEGLDVAGPRPQ